PSGGIIGLLHATELELGVSLLVAVVLGRAHWRVGHRLFLERAEARAVLRYGSRLQVTTAMALANTQVDALLVARFAGVRAAAMFGLGYQAATVVRMIPLWAVPPLFARLAHAFDRVGRD